MSYTSTGSGAGAGADPGSDSKNSPTREHADALMVSYADRDRYRDISGNIGMVNNAYYVCVGFVTSAGEAQSTQLIKVRTYVLLGCAVLYFP